MRLYSSFNKMVVDECSAHARMSGPYGNRGSSESREQTIANGSYLLLAFTSFADLTDSQQEDSKHSKCVAALRSGLSSRNPTLHPRYRA